MCEVKKYIYIQENENEIKNTIILNTKVNPTNLQNKIYLKIVPSLSLLLEY